MTNDDEDTYTINTSSPSPDCPTTVLGTLSDSRANSSDTLGSDQATISGGSYLSANSSSTNSLIAQQLTHLDMSSASPPISYTPPSNTTAPNASVLKHLAKLSSGNFVAWKRDLEIHLDACGLGGFILSKIPEPTILADVPLWRMHHAQVLLAIRTTIDGHNLNAVSGAQHPHDAISILSRRHGHGENVGLAVANSISAIVFQKFDSSISIKEFVSNTQSLHNELSELTTSHPGFNLSDEILALLMVIKLPRDRFNSIIQQLLSDLKNLTTGAVFDRLLTESQSMKPTAEDSSVALSAQQKSKKPAKGARSSKEPSALCHLPSHSLSMHSNAECRTQNLSLQPNRPTQNARPMGRTSQSLNQSSSRGLAAISSLTDAKKARLFDHLQHAQANLSVQSNAASDQTNPQLSNVDDHVVYFANAYSAMAQSATRSDDMISDTGADRFIFHSLERFVNLRPISPVSIKTADGSCHLTSHYAGDVIVNSKDEDSMDHQMILPDTLYCPKISVNLISASRLCDAGAVFSGLSDRMKYINHSTGEQLHATRRPNSSDLWAVRTQDQDQSTCLAISSDLMHQRMGHLHSAALRRFCNDRSKSTTICTSCSLAKSHRHPFKSSLPKADRILYRVHSDVVGPFQTITPSGKRYLVTFIDEYTRFAKVYLIARKDEVFDVFRSYLAESERHTGHRLCILKSDQGGEYRSTRFKAYADAHGIKLEQAPANTPQHNSVAERYNRTVMERTRAQMIHGAIPKYLWGEIVLATAHILNLSPTSSVDDVPVNLWQHHCAGNGAHLADPSFLRVLGCRAFTHIHKGDRRKLDNTAHDLIHVGYEPDSKAYQLWDPVTRKVVVSRDVTFDEACFPLRSMAIHQLPPTEDDDDDDVSMGSPTPHPAVDHPPPPPASLSPAPHSPSLPTPASSMHNTHPPPSRPIRKTRQPSRYGNVRSYASVTRNAPDDDNPTYKQAMAGPDKEHWLAAMKLEFDSLVSHSVGRLIPRPKNANVLGGMWRFKRKRDTSSNVTKYKARWVILGNHQIHGLD